MGTFSEASGEQSKQQTSGGGAGGCVQVTPLGAEDTEEEWEDVGGWEGGDSRRGLPSATRGRGGEQPGNLDLASVGEDIHTSRGR